MLIKKYQLMRRLIDLKTINQSVNYFIGPKEHQQLTVSRASLKCKRSQKEPRRYQGTVESGHLCNMIMFADTSISNRSQFSLIRFISDKLEPSFCPFLPPPNRFFFKFKSNQTPFYYEKSITRTFVITAVNVQSGYPSGRVYEKGTDLAGSG